MGSWMEIANMVIAIIGVLMVVGGMLSAGIWGVAKVTSSVDRLSVKVDALGSQVDRLGNSVDQLDMKLDEHGERITRLEAKNTES